MKWLLSLFLIVPLSADVYFGVKENTSFPLGQFSDVMKIGQTGCGLGGYSYKRFMILDEMCAGSIIGRYGRDALLIENNLLLGYRHPIKEFNIYGLVGPSFNFTAVPALVYTTGIKSTVLVGYTFGKHEVLGGFGVTNYFESMSFTTFEVSLGYLWKFSGKTELIKHGI
jgi:hypothetical protein